MLNSRESIMSYIIKEPIKCSKKELDEFCSLVKKAGEVDPWGLMNRIKKAKLLAFHYEQKAIVGIAGLKKPYEKHKTDVFRKAGIPKEASKYDLEIGWAYTKCDYRGNGICTNLIKNLLKEFESENIYATVRTNNTAMKKVLKRTGFRQIGKTYLGRNDRCIQLWVRTKENTP